MWTDAKKGLLYPFEIEHCKNTEILMRTMMNFPSIGERDRKSPTFEVQTKISTP
jgi:hypothetical protein